MEIYYIGELSKILNISRDTLRLYDQKGIVKARRLPNGYRYYSHQDRILLSYAIALKSAGLSLDEIQHMLHETDLDKANALIKAHKSQVQKQKIALELLESRLEIEADHLEKIKHFNELPKRVDQVRLYVTQEMSFDQSLYQALFDLSFLCDAPTLLGESPYQARTLVRQADQRFCRVFSDKMKAQEDRLDKTLFIVYESPSFLTGVIRCFAGFDYRAFLPYAQYIKARGLEAQGPVIFIALSLRNGPCKNVDYYEVYIPLNR